MIIATRSSICNNFNLSTNLSSSTSAHPVVLVVEVVVVVVVVVVVAVDEHMFILACVYHLRVPF